MSAFGLVPLHGLAQAARLELPASGELVLGRDPGSTGVKVADPRCSRRHASITASPDGFHVAFGWQGPNGDNWDVYVQTIGAENPRRLTESPAFEGLPAWSPDGTELAFAAGVERAAIYRIPLLGGPRIKITDCNPQIRHLNWSPDGRYLSFCDNGRSPFCLHQSS